MSAQNLRIIELRREPSTESNDTLVFEGGVNVVTGEKDAGKTVWLKMLDYLMADDAVPEDAFGAAVAAKYDSLHARFGIGNQEIKVERRWKEKGLKTKIFLNGESLNTDEFGRKLMEMLGIPLLRFPKGNPYEDRTWPELSLRMLFRHIYRQERFWTDFADKQPEVEQHACICQFMGAAAQVFPREYGELVSKQKELYQLQAQVVIFSQNLQAITDELIQHNELSVAVTEESIALTEKRLEDQITKLQEEKAQILAQVQAKQNETHDSHLQEAKRKRASLLTNINSLSQSRDKSALRAAELITYRETLYTELTKLHRAQFSGEIMADLKVTQCPACDQRVVPVEDLAVCYLCGKNHSPNQHDIASARKRIAFEIDRIVEETTELDELIIELTGELAGFDKASQDAAAELRLSERELSSVSQAAIAMLPPDFELISRQEGQVFEQLRQMRRIRVALGQKQKLATRIDELRQNESQLKAEIAAFPTPDFETLSLEIEDGMNSYLNAVSEGNPKRWGFGDLTVTLSEKAFTVKIGKRRWNTQLGVTSQALVLFAYHYALLSLSMSANRNYPGLVILDFPMELADTEAVGSSENYLLEPFVCLAERLGKHNVQLIATGRSFKDLIGAHQIRLERENMIEPVSDEIIAMENAEVNSDRDGQ
jgi:hypothetical protein